MSDLDTLLSDSRQYADDRALQKGMLGRYLEDPLIQATTKAIETVKGKVDEAKAFVEPGLKKAGETIAKDVGQVTGDERFGMLGAGVTTGGVVSGNPALAATGLAMVGMAKVSNKLIRPRFNVEEITAKALQPSPLAERVTTVVNQKTAVLPDEEAQRKAAELLKAGGVTRETLARYAPGTALSSPAQALAAQDVVTTEARTFIDTAQAAIAAGDEQMAEQALSQFTRLLDPAGSYAGAVTATAQTLRLTSSADVKAMNLLLERASKSSGTMTPLEQLKMMLADPATDPAKQGQSVTQSFRNVMAQAKEIAAQGDEAQAQLFLHEVEHAVAEDTQLSMFPDEKAVKEAQKAYRTVTEQHIVEANKAAAEKADKDTFKLTPTGPHHPKKPQTDFIKDQEKAHLATIKEHQAQDLRMSEGTSAFDEKRKPFKLTAPPGGAPRLQKPKQLDLLQAIAQETQPEQLAIEMAETISVGNPELSKQFLSMIKGAQEAIASGDQEKVGKALQRIQKVFETKAKPTDQLARPQRLVEQEKKALQMFLQRDTNKDLSPLDMLKAFVADKNLQPEALINAINNSRKQGWADAWQYLIINSMLGPTSDFVNFTATASMLPVHLASRAVGARTGQVSRMLGGGAGVMVGETSAMLHGLYAGFWDSIKLAGRVTKSGVAEIGPYASKEMVIGEQPLSSQAVFSYSPTARKLAGIQKPQDAANSELLSRAGMVSRAIDTVGVITGLPGRLMLTGDQFIQNMAMSAEQHATVYRLAAQEAIKQGVQEEAFRKSYGPLWRDIAKDLPEDIRKRGEVFSLDVSLNAELGKLGGAAMHAREIADQYTGIGGTIAMPFFRTLVNSTKATWEFTPLGPVSQAGAALAGKAAERLDSNALRSVAKIYRDDMFGADPVKRDIAMGKWAVGSMIMSSLVWSAVDGRLRGRGPDNKELRQESIAAQGLPDSFVFNADDGSSIQINRLGILGNLAGMAADVAEVWLQADDLTRGDIAQLLTTAFVGNLSFDFLQGTGGILQALANGVKTKQDLDLIAKSIPALVPLGATIRAGEKLAATPDDPILMKDARDTLDKIMARFPGYDTLAEKFGLPKVPVLRNQFGYAVKQSASAWGTEWFNPLYISRPSQQDGLAELAEIELKLGVAIQEPPRTVGPHGLRLSNEEYDQLQKLAGAQWEQRAKAILPTLRRDDVPDQVKRNLIESNIREARGAASRQLFGVDPSVSDAIAAQKKYLLTTPHTLHPREYQRPAQ